MSWLLIFCILTGVCGINAGLSVAKSNSLRPLSAGFAVMSGLLAILVAMMLVKSM